MCNLCLSPGHQENTCEACLCFKSKKTIRDRRAPCHQMSRGSGLFPDIFHPGPDSLLEQVKEEQISVSEADNSDVDDAVTPAQQTVSTETPAPPNPIQEAPVTPSPSGPGLHRSNISDAPTSGPAMKIKDKPSGSGSSQPHSGPDKTPPAPKSKHILLHRHRKPFRQRLRRRNSQRTKL